MGRPKKEHGQFAYMKRIYSGLAQEVITLQKRLKELDKKERFLRAEALKHQVQLTSDSEIKCLLKSKSDSVHLKEEDIEVVKKQMVGQTTVSANHVMSASVIVESVEGMDEEEEEEEEEKQQKGISTPVELGILKRWKVEGKIGHCFYSIHFLANYDMENPLGVITQVEELQATEGNPVIQEIIDYKQDGPFKVQQLTNLLFGLQMLYEARDEAIAQLKDIPNLEIQHAVEPVTVEFEPKEGYLIKVVWTIEFDKKNMRVKNNIAVICEDEVTARFSRSAGFPYLSGRELLTTHRGVIEFVESYMED
ncbi:uncharacterized protein LOC122247402 isoform X2 [Penaeus japonicus]|nr:uncharacterized protein LOC122247402 isoform X2 [Penaeus japonicus]XP_042862596.1 uncharacterized protein LOC122247402 isoform X2 [Penaeus japonicus]XP_042862597.1 uncharacterized protein LOC122247402 isoform X2 [Penaeus japonicus]